ncbi:unnamed protein product [Caenorhabditis angaria]|uniref:Uncharacterized protein n=1 Tax=Caenorhabditis angaria TaxID=860376 RepID=A0A9P1I9B2_9PELO|nr:unnamed protein product [Caenorhabditis angaria]
MMIFTILLLIFSIFHCSENLMAYDSANQFLNIPHNEIHVITDAIDNYKPNLRVRFLNLNSNQNSLSKSKKRKANLLQDGFIRIQNNVTENRKSNRTSTKIENVKVVENGEKIELRFGGGSKAHFPYNRVVDWYGRSSDRFHTTSTTTTTTTTLPPTPPQITPKKWALSTTTTIAPNYSAQPALYLPSRFHKRKENIVIVYKKKV